MTQDQRREKVLDRINAAKQRREYDTWPEFRYRVNCARLALERDDLDGAEEEIATAERASLRYDIRTMALKMGPEVIQDVEYYLSLNRDHDALEVVLKQ